MRKSTTNAVIFLAVAVLAAFSCSDQAEFIKGSTPIRISVGSKEVRATSIKASIIPENDKVYYSCGIVEKSKHSPGQGDLRFMQLSLDSLYRDYIDWRYLLLRENANYVAPFSSHCLHYGNDSHFFLELKQDTDYIIYAFCVNPETNQPVGDLYSLPVRTAKFQPSSMTFKWERRGTQILVTPSNDDEYYIWDVIDKETLDGWYGSSAEAYLKDYVQVYAEYGLLRDDLCQSISSYNFDYLFSEAGSYYFIVAGYDGEFTTTVYSEEFSIDKL